MGLTLYTIVYWALLGPHVPVGGPALITVDIAHGLLFATTVILLSQTASRSYINSTHRPSAWRRRTA